MVFFLAIAAMGVLAPDDAVSAAARESFDRLVARYADVRCAQATWTRVPSADGTGSDKGTARARVVVSEEGRFAYDSWDAPVPAPGVEPGAPSPASYYVYYDGGTIFNAYGEGSRYTMSSAKAEFDGWHPMQHHRAPWALMERWREEALRRSSIWNRVGLAPSDAGEQFSVRIPAGRDRTLEIDWTEEDGLTSLAWSADGECTRTTFRSFTWLGGNPVPRLAEREVRESTSDGALGKVMSRATWSLEVELNPIDAEARLAFDPVARNVGFFDEARGDIYSPDRARKLWNLDDVNASLGEARDVARFWRRGGLVLLAGAIAVSMWRLLRARSAP